jgi:hypothetical protein
MVKCWCVLLAGISACASAATVAVLDLVPYEVSADHAKAATEFVINEIATYGGYRVLEPGRVREAIAARGKGAPCADDSCAVDVARTLGADRVIVGSLTGAGRTVFLSVRLLDVSGESVARVAQGKRVDISQLDGLVREAVAGLLSDEGPASQRKRFRYEQYTEGERRFMEAGLKAGDFHRANALGMDDPAEFSGHKAEGYRKAAVGLGLGGTVCLVGAAAACFLVQDPDLIVTVVVVAVEPVAGLYVGAGICRAKRIRWEDRAARASRLREPLEPGSLHHSRRAAPGVGLTWRF